MPLDIRIRFGRAIRRAREQQGINQEEAASRIFDQIETHRTAEQIRHLEDAIQCLLKKKFEQANPVEQALIDPEWRYA